MTIARPLTALLLFASSAFAQEVHYAPKERLDAIDAALIATARNSIDDARKFLPTPRFPGRFAEFARARRRTRTRPTTAKTIPRIARRGASWLEGGAGGTGFLRLSAGGRFFAFRRAPQRPIAE
jgi:hypothetical protein